MLSGGRDTHVKLSCVQSCLGTKNGKFVCVVHECELCVCVCGISSVTGVVFVAMYIMN